MCAKTSDEPIEISITINGYKCAVLRCEDTVPRLCHDEHELTFYAGDAVGVGLDEDRLVELPPKGESRRLCKMV